MHDRKNKNHAVKAIENASMSWNQFSGVLNTKVTLDGTFHQVTKLGKGTKDDHQNHGDEEGLGTVNGLVHQHENEGDHQG